MHDETVSTEVAKEYLRDVAPMWKAFWFHMHLVAKNLEEFADGLERIDDKVYEFHASGQKNDFEKWVREVIGDSVLARRLSGVRSKKETAEIVRTRVEALRRAVSEEGTTNT